MTEGCDLSIENVMRLPFFSTDDDPVLEVTLFKTNNHVFRIRTGDMTYYLKTHTRDWYSENGKETGHVVLREATAWQIIEKIGLATPRVVAIDNTTDNVIGIPFIITEELLGESLTELLTRLSRADAYSAIRCVGAYLKKMHSISFGHSGYLPPQEPVISSQWHHRIWSYHGFQSWADREQETAKKELSHGSFSDVLRYINEWQHKLRKVYKHPRFVHGDCRANQFYLFQRGREWNVSGVLDMEVASAGDCDEDFMKFCAEMSRRFDVETKWWEPLFDGYEEEPDFNLLKLRYLASGQLELSPFAYKEVAGVRELVVQHLLRAKNWLELFDLSSIKEKYNNLYS